MPPPSGPVKMASNYKKPSNLKTALILLSVAAVFFAGVIFNRYLFPEEAKAKAGSAAHSQRTSKP